MTRQKWAPLRDARGEAETRQGGDGVRSHGAPERETPRGFTLGRVALEFAHRKSQYGGECERWSLGKGGSNVSMALEGFGLVTSDKRVPGGLLAARVEYGQGCGLYVLAAVLESVVVSLVGEAFALDIAYLCLIAFVGIHPSLFSPFACIRL